MSLNVDKSSLPIFPELAKIDHVPDSSREMKRHLPQEKQKLTTLACKQEVLVVPLFFFALEVDAVRDRRNVPKFMP